MQDLKDEKNTVAPDEDREERCMKDRLNSLRLCRLRAVCYVIFLVYDDLMALRRKKVNKNMAKDLDMSKITQQKNSAPNFDVPFRK